MSKRGYFCKALARAIGSGERSANCSRSHWWRRKSSSSKAEALDFSAKAEALESSNAKAETLDSNAKAETLDSSVNLIKILSNGMSFKRGSRSGNPVNGMRL